MTSYSQSNNATNFLTADMDAVLGMIRTANITSFEMYFGVFIVRMTDGVNAFELDLIGSELAITGSPGAYVLSGTVSTAYLRMPGTGLSDRSVTIQNFSTSLADFFADPKALFTGNDFVTGGNAPNALYGYGGDDYLNGQQNAAGVAVQDSLYGGDGNDTFTITETGNVVETNPVIDGGAGRDRVLLDWTNLGSTAVLDSGRLTSTPTGVEVVQFSYASYEYPIGYTYLNAKITAPAGTGLLSIAGLQEIIDLQQITATSAGTIDLSAVTITDSTDSSADDAVFRYFGSAGDDAFLAPLSFSAATDIAYYGYGGNDTLGGAAPLIETLVGGAEDDTYIFGEEILVTASRDVIVELAGEGTDTVLSRTTTSLATVANVENLTLMGSANINGIGNAENNLITGNGGNNILNGGTSGTDTLRGGAGNDTYLLRAGITVVELAGAGIDTAVSLTSATLADHVDHLTLSGTAAINGTGNGIANRLTGNSAANLLTGLGGNDTLTGGAGADTLAGGAGDDSYIVDAQDNLVEAANAGTDTISSAATRTLGANLEHLILTGSAVANGIGNDLANSLAGNGANNILVGGAGADTLIGNAGVDRLASGLGKDQMSGGAGNDVFDFNLTTESGTTTTTADEVIDFVAGQDRIDLYTIDAFAGTTGNNLFVFRGTAAFSSATAGEVRFQQVNLAGTASDYTMVFIDTDGDTGAEMAIRLKGLITLTATDFVL